MPTRLIKLESDGISCAKICSTQNLVKFAALSYRWGADTQSATLKENVDQRYQTLTTSDFPRTLQDAIHVTRRLGLEYIWIDRICIIQDDNDDWAKEASLMANIYETAYVVLSATATADCGDGFLQRRLKPPLVIQYTHIGQEDCEVRARLRQGHNCGKWPLQVAYPLLQRGWCMQERLLARRIIHFLPDEIIFQCENGQECECGAASKGDTYAELADFPSLRRASDIESSEPREPKFSWKWMSIVSDYSKMGLTYGDDTLPALSGLAACMEHLKPGNYIAGHWQHNIVSQLGWRVNPKFLGRRWKCPEDADVIGPTFSWSSHAHPVNMGNYRYIRNISTLENFEVELATPNPYGKVRHASLRLSGPVVSGDKIISWLKMSKASSKKARVMLDTGFSDLVPFPREALPSPNSWHHNGTKRREEPTMVVDSSAVIDARYEESNKIIAWKSAIFFGLYEIGDMGSNTLDALLLQPRGTGTGEYVRIGVVTDIWNNWFYEHAVSTKVTVV